jgi:hypothetical protein
VWPRPSAPTPLRYNRSDPFLPDLVVCRAEVAAQVLAVIARVERNVQ